ncbi:MAG TPA: efflux RND transporter periplasmic adaptor subunit [Gemmatimonadaceae bacterium]|nr:efflux RND transporter periplasmic adaptor subunit [Gemmatimonadaceae bacterium]
MNRKILSLAAALAAFSCGKAPVATLQVQTDTVQRRDIVVNAEATGVIEPINVVEIKSKTASGQILAMTIDVGTYVRSGDLIVQIDTTDLHTQLVQYLSDKDAAQQTYDVAKQVLDRNQTLFDQHVITKDVLENAQNSEANAKAALLRAETNVTLQLQKLKDSKVVAAVEGTILTKPVSIGQVIQAGGGSVSGGTVIATMADLTQVRARALVAETEIGQLQVGQDAVVTVDAYPDRAFNGTVEKIEPQAVVQQNVTMFPVLISLNNAEGLLRPGMNGEVNVRTNERDQVLSVRNDAIRSPREWEQSARALGLNPDSVRAIAMPTGNGRGGRGGFGSGGNAGGGAPGAPGATTPAPGRGGPEATTSRAELDPALLQGGGAAGAGQGAAQGGGRRGGGRGQLPEVTDAQCKKVDDALKAKPAVAKKLDDLRTQMRDPNADRQALNTQQEALYKELGVDAQVARACRFRQQGGRGGPQGAQGTPGAGEQGGFAAGSSSFGGRNGRMGGRGGRGGRGGGARQDPNATPRTGLVFVQKGTSWEPRLLRLGVANYDYTEVVSGVQEGEKVAIMSAAIMQLRRQDQMDRTRANASPLGGGGGPGGGGPRGGGGGRGGR